MSTIIGNTEFNNSNNNGAVTGEAVFNGDSTNVGIVVGDAYFSDTSTNTGTIDGNAAFYDTAVNSGEVIEAAAFLGEAQNNGEIGQTMTEPEITAQPQTVKKLSGTGNAEFSISGEGAMLNCNWTNGSCGGPYGKYAEYRVITIDDPGQGQSRACDVLCKLENPAGQTTGNLALCIFGVFPSVDFTQNPGNITVDEYTDVTLNLNGTSNDDKVLLTLVNAGNNAIITSGTEISVTNGSYNVQNVVVAAQVPFSANNTSVRVRVSDSFGENYSQPFMLFVNDMTFDPQIIQQPQSVEAYPGQTVSFTIVASDAVDFYKWLLFNANNPPLNLMELSIPAAWSPVGENTSTLTVTIPEGLPLGYYDPNNIGGLCFHCFISHPDSPGDGTGAKIPLMSYPACMTIIEPPQPPE
jgi:hypothetical protein